MMFIIDNRRILWYNKDERTGEAVARPAGPRRASIAGINSRWILWGDGKLIFIRRIYNSFTSAAFPSIAAHAILKGVIA